MSELRERRWAVLSERGCEGAGLGYEEAAGLVARLRGGRMSGLCIVTDEAASRLSPAGKAAPARGDGKGAAAGARPRRGRKKTAA